MIEVKKKEAAFVVVDCQKFILTEGGLGARLGVWKYARETNMIENTKRAIQKAREVGIPVIYHKLSLRPGIVPDVGFWKEFKGIDLAKVTDQFEIVDELYPHPEDHVITKYYTMNGFLNTDFDQLLRQLNINTLIFAGVVTNLCVESTVRGAFDRGYKVIVLSDCTASMNAEAHTFPIKVVFPMLGEVATLDELEFVP